MDRWIEQAAAEIGKRAPRELEALVAVSSPSGDVHGANECASVCAALVPDEATIERVPCSSPDHAEDLIARLHAEIAKAGATPDVRRRFEALGMEVADIGPEEFRAHIRSELHRWAKGVRDVGIKPD